MFFAACDLEGMTDLDAMMSDFDPAVAEEEEAELQEEAAEAEREAAPAALEQFSLRRRREEEEVRTLYAAATPWDVAYWEREYRVGLAVLMVLRDYWRDLSPELQRDLLEADPSIAEMLT